MNQMAPGGKLNETQITPGSLWCVWGGGGRAIESDARWSGGGEGCKMVVGRRGGGGGGGL